MTALPSCECRSAASFEVTRKQMLSRRVLLALFRGVAARRATCSSEARTLSVAGGVSRPPRVTKSARLRHDPDVRPRRFPLAEGLLRLGVGDGAGDDHVLAVLPV